jgi:hypothetical protein
MLVPALLPGRSPQAARPAASQGGSSSRPLAASLFGSYPGQQDRGVFQTISRIAASGNTIVATGAQTSDGITRQQFLVSADGGTSWHLARIAPQLPGDQIWVLTSTVDGFLAAGSAKAADGTTQAVIWTSRTGVTWQRMTAAQLGLAGPGQSVPGIYYAASSGDDTLIGDGGYGTWLSTDGGSYISG